MTDAADRPWVWRHPHGWNSNDLGRFGERLYEVAAARGFGVESLGEVGGEALLLLTRPATAAAAPRLLIASGFHGDEAAGPWGVLAFLESVGDPLLDAVTLSALPLVNASGFRAGRRLNDQGENPNRGYTVAEASGPSREGRLLLAQRERLLPLAADGLLACHEDVGLSQCYVYGLERAAIPGAFSRGLIAVNAEFFPMHPDGEVDGCPVRDGIVFNHADTSFEYWMMRQGVRRAACIETPGQQPIGRRIAAQAAMMRFFVEQAAFDGTSQAR